MHYWWSYEHKLTRMLEQHRFHCTTAKLLHTEDIHTNVHTETLDTVSPASPTSGGINNYKTINYKTKKLQKKDYKTI